MKIGLIGLGIMGAGIAQVSAVNGHEMIVTDVDKKFYDRAVQGIAKSLDKLASKGMVKVGKEEVFSRITYTDDPKDFSDCELIIEAVVENLEEKRKVFRNLEPYLKDDAILASNTSSISITALASQLKNPSNFVGIHFFNPVPLMNLVEVIRGIRTSQGAIDKAVELSRSIGKEHVIVNDSPGFVTTRIIVMLVNEGAFEYSENLASVEDIDKALKLGGNFPMGPLKLGDLIGLDTVVNIMDTLADSYRDPKFRAAPILRKMVEAGKLGKKSGEGFYKY